MPYTQQTWTDNSLATVISAARLTHMENGIFNASSSAGPGGWVDVKAAGATGNGTTDDTSAINSAISGSAVGSTIWFPPGTYLVSSTIVLYPDRTYLGAGGIVGKTTIKATTAVTGAILGGQGWYNNTLTTCDDPIVIRGLNIIGPGKGTGSAAGIVLVSFWTRIEDVFVQTTGSHGILQTDVTRNASVLTNSAATCSENKIINCKLDSIGGDGIHIGNQAAFNTNQDGHVDNCQLSNIGSVGIRMDQAGGWHLTNNHFYGITSSGIVANAGFATHITGNYIEDFGSENGAGNNYAGIKLVQGSGWASTVADNFVNNTQGNNSTTATQWASYDIEANSSATAAAPSVITVVDNSTLNTITATTKLAYGFYYTTAAAIAGAMQVRSTGNYIGATGWTGTGSPLTGAQTVTNTTNIVLNGATTSF